MTELPQFTKGKKYHILLRCDPTGQEAYFKGTFLELSHPAPTRSAYALFDGTLHLGRGWPDETSEEFIVQADHIHSVQEIKS